MIPAASGLLHFSFHISIQPLSLLLWLCFLMTMQLQVDSRANLCLEMICCTNNFINPVLRYIWITMHDIAMRRVGVSIFWEGVLFWREIVWEVALVTPKDEHWSGPRLAITPNLSTLGYY